jgi:hypothetical protein
MSRKILVVSDSHGNNTNLRKAIEVFGTRGEQLERLIHLGDMQVPLEEIQRLADCPVEAVRGNCDFAPELPAVKLLPIGGELALITHGHRYNCRMGTAQMKELARENGAGLVLFGHTHEPLMELDSDVKVLNPGSISLPRQDGHRPTYLVITIEEDNRLEFAAVTM